MAKNAKVTEAKISEAQTEVTNNESKATALTIVRPEQLQIVRGTGKRAAAEVTPIPSEVLDELNAIEPKLNTVNKVKTLYASGYSRPQIVAAGFNSSTVYRQVGEYIKAQSAAQSAKDAIASQE